MSHLLFQVSGTDALTTIAVQAVLGTVALLSCAIPARRVSRLSPMAALRHEGTG
jgi:ABC-type antimicrobial peptide transport system permease subunit